MYTASPRSLRGPLPLSPESIPDVAGPLFIPARMKSILDRSFPYVPAAATDVAATWKRFGFSAQANAERRARLLSTADEDEATEAARLHELFIRVAAARQAT